MARPPVRLSGGRLVFLSAADEEAYIEEQVRARFEERLREHIRKHPQLTPGQISGAWAAFAIAKAAERG